MISLKDDIASDMAHTILTIKFELRKHWRRKRLMISLALAVILPLLFYAIPIIAEIDFPDTANQFASRNMGFIGLLIVISVALFAGDAVSGEFEHKTALQLFPTPQRRTSIFLGKYVAGMLAVFAVVSVYYVATGAEILKEYGTDGISTDLVKSYLVALVYSTSALSVVFTLSCLAKRSITSTLLGFFLLMMILPIVGTVCSFVDVDPWFIVTSNSDLITDVLVLSSSDISTLGPGSESTASVFEPDFYAGLWVMTAYTLALFIVSMAIAMNKKME